MAGGVMNSRVRLLLALLAFASACAEGPPQTAAPFVASAGTMTPGAPVATCSPAYPSVCVPPPPPVLGCSQVGVRNFKVLPPDPHHFDGDGDGIGCEN